MSPFFGIFDFWVLFYSEFYLVFVILWLKLKCIPCSKHFVSSKPFAFCVLEIRMRWLRYPETRSLLALRLSFACVAVLLLKLCFLIFILLFSDWLFMNPRKFDFELLSKQNPNFFFLNLEFFYLKCFIWCDWSYLRLYLVENELFFMF